MCCGILKTNSSESEISVLLADFETKPFLLRLTLLDPAGKCCSYTPLVQTIKNNLKIITHIIIITHFIIHFAFFNTFKLLGMLKGRKFVSETFLLCWLKVSSHLVAISNLSVLNVFI